jgi:hypothetical protein
VTRPFRWRIRMPTAGMRRRNRVLVEAPDGLEQRSR